MTSSLLAVDCTISQDAMLIPQSATLDKTQIVEVNGITYLFVKESVLIEFYDISNGANPLSVGETDNLIGACGANLEVVGTFASADNDNVVFISKRCGDILSYDLTNMPNARECAKISRKSPETMDVYKKGSKRYLLVGGIGIKYTDYTNLGTSSQVKPLLDWMSGFFPVRIRVDGDYLTVSTSNSVDLYNISAMPSYSTVASCSGYTPFDAYFDEASGFIYECDADGKFKVINPLFCTTVGEVDIQASSVSFIEKRENLVFIALGIYITTTGQGGFRVIDVSNPSLPVDVTGGASVFFTGEAAISAHPSSNHFYTSAGSPFVYSYTDCFSTMAGPLAVPDDTFLLTGDDVGISASWSSSCGPAQDYTIYEGDLDLLAASGTYSHDSLDCSDLNGDLTETFSPSPGNSYYLVVPKTIFGTEGGYGEGRPQGTDSAGCGITDWFPGECTSARGSGLRMDGWHQGGVHYLSQETGEWISGGSWEFKVEHSGSTAYLAGINALRPISAGDETLDADFSLVMADSDLSPILLPPDGEVLKRTIRFTHYPSEGAGSCDYEQVWTFTGAGESGWLADLAESRTCYGTLHELTASDEEWRGAFGITRKSNSEGTWYQGSLRFEDERAAPTEVNQEYLMQESDAFDFTVESESKGIDRLRKAEKWRCERVHPLGFECDITAQQENETNRMNNYKAILGITAEPTL